jgi:hypothetical protein
VLVYRGGETLRSLFSIAVLIILTLIVVSVALVVGWWVVSVLVHPLPYSDPDAMSALRLSLR